VILWMTALLVAAGPLGVTLLMGIESACIPLPSEVIHALRPATWPIRANEFPGPGRQPVAQILTAGLFGAVGCNLGSIPAFELGAWGGRKAVEALRQIHPAEPGPPGPGAPVSSSASGLVHPAGAHAAGGAHLHRPARRHRQDGPHPVPPLHLRRQPALVRGPGLGRLHARRTLGNPGAIFHKFDLAIGLVLAAGAVWFVWHHIASARRRQL